jgi:hypothetical protein
MVLTAALVFWAAGVSAQGRRYAVLIGVGSYTFLPRSGLEGPPHDVHALQRVLVGDWGFDPRDVIVLLDRAASKAAILATLDQLAETTRPGDFVFLYFSGHGTSGYDRTFRDVGIDGNSGALIPSDFRPGPTARLKEGLIIGSRDLRPRLERLDRGRRLFVVFDSCFSGNAARMVFAAGAARYLPPTELVTDGDAARSLVHTAEEEGTLDTEPSPTTEPPFPYRNVIYISAAAKSEKAVDISSAALRTGRARTVDGEPHGALTNALLEALAGAADTNRDGRTTYGELYEYVKDRVTQSFPHQPQLLAPAAAEGLLNDAILASRPGTVSAAAHTTPTAAPAVDAGGSLRVKIADLAPELARRIAGVAGVTLVTGPGAYDLLLTQGPFGYRLYDGSGDELASFPPGSAPAVVERVARQVAVRELIDLRFPDQDFNVTVDIPGNRGFLRERDSFAIDVSAERPSHILVFDVDTAGTVSVLYPFTRQEARPVRRGRVPAPPDTLSVSPPFGTEYIKAVAFEERPAGFDRWIEASFSPTGPDLVELLRMLRTARGHKAQARLKVVTRAAGQ